MKFTCTQENFSKGLTIVSRLSEKSSNLPILNNVLISARKDGITLTTTNLEIGITTTLRGKIDEEGEFTVPAKLISDFVNSLSRENITVVLTDNSLEIQGENHKTTIRGTVSTDFPTLPEIEESTDLQFSLKDFKELLQQTTFSMSLDESRPELNGAFLQAKSNTCTIAATDSFRLSEKTVNLKNKVDTKYEGIVPARTVMEVLRALEVESGDTVIVRVNDNQVQFEIGATVIISRTVAGEYPEYTQIIPDSFENIVEFSISDMIAAIKTTSLFCKQGINDVRISLEKRFDNIVVQAENSQHGKNVSNVKSLSKDQELDIVFNYKYVLDGLQRMDGETAFIKTNNPTSPAMITPVSDSKFVYIIMPIRQ